MSLVNIYSLHMLVACARESSQSSYEQVAISAYGTRAAKIVNVAIALGAISALVSFIIVLGDVLPAVLRTIVLAGRAPDHSRWYWYLDRRLVTAAVVLLVMAPLSLLGSRLSALRYSSTVAIGTFFYIVVAIAVQSGTRLAALDFWAQVVLVNPGIVGIAQTIPIFAFALGLPD